MMSYLLDSDILTDFFKKKKEALGLVVKLSQEGNLAASVLSVAELRAGWTQKQAKQILPKFYKLFTIATITTGIAELAGELRQEYKQKGYTLPLIDVLIAATAITDGCQLVTRNKKDYFMRGVKLYNL